MNDELLHPVAHQIEAYVEGSLDDADRAVLESHLNSCARCTTELEEWRAIFAALSSLPHVEPLPGFADRVMAGVRISVPWPARVAALLRRLIPGTTSGWMLMAALLALPVLATGGALAWLFSHPGLTPGALWFFLRARAADALLSLAGRAGTAVVESEAAVQLVEWTRMLLAQAGTSGLGAMAASFATLIVLSTWILYQNLFRTSTRGKPHATYCI